MRITEFLITWRDLLLNFIGEMKQMFSAKSLKEIVVDAMNQVSESVQIFRGRLSNLPQTNIDLALYHYNKSNLKDAVFRFNMIKRFYKDYPYADYYLGRCYLELNNAEKAKTHLASYLASNNKDFVESAEYCYRIVLRDIQSIKNVPDIIAERVQDQIAKVYNDVFFKSDDNYCNLIIASLNKYFSEIKSPYGNKALDLCAATGKISEAIKFHKISNSIDAFAISQNMMDIATNLKLDNLPVFHSIKKHSISEIISSANLEKYKLVLADNLMTFTSDVNSIVSLISAALDENGVGVLVFRNNKTDADFAFDYVYEEFTYNIAYVEKCVHGIGMKIYMNQNFKFPNGDIFSVMLLIK